MTLPPNVVDYFALRFQVLMIPFLYWFVLPSFRKNDSAIKLLCYSSLIPLGSAMFDLSRGIVGHTDNGELRLLWGGVSLLYAFVLITNLRFFSHTKTNFFLAVVAGVGLTLANHRSAYLVIAFLIIVVLLVSNRGSSRLPGITSLGIGVLLVVAVLISVPSLWESFLSRLSTSLDTNDINAVGRLSRWELSWTFFLSNPLNGSMLSYQYYGVQLRDNFPPHNFVFELLTTEGVVGTMFYLLLIFWIARIAFSHRWDQTMWQMFLAIIFYVGFCLFNTNFLGPWNFLEFALPCSMVMFRHQCLTSD